MAALKAPRSDGFLVIFYKEYWEIVGGNLVKAVISFFESGRMLREVNNSFVVLIPKNQSPVAFNHFRPISLSNVVYKIISRLIVVIIRPLLSKLIGSYQSSFILGGWIAENEVIFQEVLHSFNGRKLKDGKMADKLQKAYDRANW